MKKQQKRVRLAVKEEFPDISDGSLELILEKEAFDEQMTLKKIKKAIKKGKRDDYGRKMKAPMKQSDVELGFSTSFERKKAKKHKHEE